MDNHTNQLKILRADSDRRKLGELAVRTFSDDPTEEAVDDFVKRATSCYDIQDESVRALVGQDGAVLGGYLLRMRTLCFGPTRLPVACIGAVAVDQNIQKQGHGSRLMKDAVDFSRTNGIGMLLLTGIPNYYDRFGYRPAIAETELYLDQDAVRQITETSSICVRRAVDEDAAMLLQLYQRHRQPLIGSFERPLSFQRLLLSHETDRHHQIYLIASDSNGDPTGYLLLNRRYGSLDFREVAAEDWPTISALLRAHLRLIDDEPASSSAPQATDSDLPAKKRPTIYWSVPKGTTAYYNLVDRIPCREETLHHPSADWMACLGDPQAYTTAMVPTWQERLAASPITWDETIRMQVGDTLFCLRIDGGSNIGVSPWQRDMSASGSMELSDGSVAQLTFGFRPAAHIAQQMGNRVEHHLLALLEVLFPQLPCGVAGSDYF